MGKFDGILICSDIDGTFTGGDDAIAQNTEAVKYFTKNGGRFTFATGRMSGHLEKLGFFGIVNAPVCLCNGGIIFDQESKSPLWEKHLDFTLKDFLDVMKEYPDKDILFYIFKNSIEENSYNLKLEDINSTPEDILSINPIKIVNVFKTKTAADAFKESLTGFSLFKNCFSSKSWPFGVEINPEGATKREAIKYIKNHLGNIRTAIGIGDYENDIPLLQGSDIAVATGNALDSVKEIADMVVCDASKAAIRELIMHLDCKY